MRQPGYYFCNVRGAVDFGPAQKLLCYYGANGVWFIPGFHSIKPITQYDQYSVFSSIDEEPIDPNIVVPTALSPKDITYYTNELATILKFMTDKKSDLNLMVASIDRKTEQIWRMLTDIRSKCNHAFPNKEPGMMGRGKCIICGHDDY